MGQHRAVEVVSDRQMAVEAGVAAGGIAGVALLGAGVITAPPGDRVLLGLFITCVVVLVWLLALVAGSAARWLERQERERVAEDERRLTELEGEVRRVLIGAAMPRDWEGATRERIGGW